LSFTASVTLLCNSAKIHLASTHPYAILGSRRCFSGVPVHSISNIYFSTAGRGQKMSRDNQEERTGERLVFNPKLNVCDWPSNVSVDDNPAPRKTS
jgi:hypothetical protein